MFSKFRSRSRSRSKSSSQRLSTPASSTEIVTDSQKKKKKGRGIVFWRTKEDTAQSISEIENPLGLNLFYDPSDGGAVDIVFIHGLGGGSRRTWSMNKDPNKCWPEKWLGNDLGGKARIFSFGYNSNFISTEDNDANVIDFAKQLMNCFHGEHNPRLGSRPTMFIVHSMGGLIAKQAYILMYADPAFKEIFPNIRGIIFLATPHRGSDYGATLAKIIAASPFHSEKRFVLDLKRNSSAVSYINEQFRHIVKHLRVASFFETLGTPVFGGKYITVVEPDSGIMGYPDEITVPMNDNHHTICKYDSQQSSSYKMVLGVINVFVKDFDPTPIQQEQAAKLADRVAEDEIKDVQEFLSCPKVPEDDYIWYRSRRMEKTCEWLLDRPFLKEWKQSSGSSILWLNGNPALGKSVLTATVIEHLRAEEKHTAYFFFRHGDKLKQSNDFLARSFAYQLALLYPAVRQFFCELHQQKMDLTDSKGYMIWHKVIKRVFQECALQVPVYWVIDALDEADNPQEVLNWLYSMPSDVPLNVLISGRKTPQINTAFSRFDARLTSYTLVEEDIMPDIERYVSVEIKALPARKDLQDEIVQKIVGKSAGSFLWAKLVTDEVLDVGHTVSLVRSVLDGFPSGMDPLYKRALDGLKNLSKFNKTLAKIVLTWTMCALRPLSLEELAAGLEPAFGDFLNLKRTIQQVCGQFVVVDDADQVQLIHKTARDFLTASNDEEFGINLDTEHEYLAEACLRLVSKSMRIISQRLQATDITIDEVRQGVGDLLEYAVVSWAEHLSLSGIRSKALFEALFEFLQKDILTWCSFLALSGNLDGIVRTANCLRAANMKVSKREKGGGAALVLWARDLERLISNFGPQLANCPRAVTTFIPSLCPSQSMMHRYGDRVSVVGNLALTWDEWVAQIQIIGVGKPTCMACSSNLVAVGTHGGMVIGWYMQTYQRAFELKQQGPVIDMIFSGDGRYVMTASQSSVTSWGLGQPEPHKISSYELVEEQVHLQSMHFARTGALQLATSDGRVHQISVDLEGTLRAVDSYSLIFKDDSLHPARFDGHSRAMLFNAGASRLLTTCSETYIFLLWDMVTREIIGRPSMTLFMETARKINSTASAHETALIADALAFNPVTGVIYTSCSKTGVLLKWNPATDLAMKMFNQKYTCALACSADGKFLAGGHNDNTVTLWDASTLLEIRSLSCPETTTTALTFSDNGSFLYALHCSSYTVWRLEDLNASDSNDIQSTWSFIEEVNRRLDFSSSTAAITAMACSGDGRYIVCGRRDGILSIYSSDTGREIPCRQPKGASQTTETIKGAIRAVEISPSTTHRMSHLAFTTEFSFSKDNSNTPEVEDRSNLFFRDSLVSITEVQAASRPNGTAAFSLSLILGQFEPKKTLGKIILSLTSTRLLHTDDNNVLVSTTEDGQTVLKVLLEDVPRAFSDRTTGLAVHFPQLEYFNPASTCARKPAEISQGFFPTLRSIEQLSQLLSSDDGLCRVYYTTDTEILAASSNPAATRTFSITVSRTVKEPNPEPRITTFKLPQIRTILGMYKSVLVWLDMDLWICSLDLHRIGRGEFAYRGCYRHFFMPQSWLAEQGDKIGMGLCRMAGKTGGFVYTRQGGIVVVNGGMDIGHWHEAK